MHVLHKVNFLYFTMLYTIYKYIRIYIYIYIYTYICIRIYAIYYVLITCTAIVEHLMI